MEKGRRPGKDLEGNEVEGKNMREILRVIVVKTT